MLGLSSLYGAIGVLDSPAAGMTLKVALASFNTEFAAVAGPGMLVAHGDLQLGLGGEL